jgi:hypothetical protein
VLTTGRECSTKVFDERLSVTVALLRRMTQEGEKEWPEAVDLQRGVSD